MSGRICYSFNNSLGSSLWWLFYFPFPTFLSSFLLLISFFLIGYALFFNFEVAPLSYFKLCNWLTGFFIIVRWETSTIRDIYLPFLSSIYLSTYPSVYILPFNYIFTHKFCPFHCLTFMVRLRIDSYFHYIIDVHICLFFKFSCNKIVICNNITRVHIANFNLFCVFIYFSI